MLSLGEILEVISVVGSVTAAIIAAIWFGSRWTASIEKGIEGVKGEIKIGHEVNTTEHREIAHRIDIHNERILSIEETLRKP